MKKYFDLYGARPSLEDLRRYEQSQYWKGNSFKNLEKTNLSISLMDIPKLLYNQFFSQENRTPKKAIAVKRFDRDCFLQDEEKAKMVWYGHSVLMIRMNQKTILIDPMFGPDASPIVPIAIKRYCENTLDIIDDLPEIDLLLLSHDHYDHLDYKSIQKLKSKTKKYYVALGIKRHLVKWGIDSSKIEEFNWWQDETYAGIEITFTPTRHFSGRGLMDRAKSLWGGWTFKTQNENIWFSGDGGYGEHFKLVGERLGPFDFAFMECGQYNALWEDIHMFPSQSVQAAKDANVQKAMPVHWAGFTLAHHSWTEPAEEFNRFAKAQNLKISLPRLGEVFDIEQDLSINEWWK